MTANNKTNLPIWFQIALLIVPMVGSSVVWYAANQREDDKIEWERAQEMLSIESRASEQWQQRFFSVQTQMIALSKEIEELRFANADDTPPIDVAKRIVRNHPGISWVKVRIAENDYRMVQVSNGYAELFLKAPTAFYYNKSDFEVWPEDVAREFARGDELAYRTPNGVDVYERTVSSDGTVSGYFVGHKWYVRLESGQDLIFGSGYFITDDETPE